MSDEAKNTLDAVKEEIKDAVSARFSSPLLVAFIISWLAWNHRLIFVLFSDLDVDKRFAFIDENLYPTALAFIGLHILGPFVSALLYIYVLPWPTEWVYKWNLKRQSRLRYAKLQQEGERLLSEQEGLQLRTINSRLKVALNTEKASSKKIARNILALRVKLSVGVGDKARNAIFDRYLKSQEFEVYRRMQKHSSSPWVFEANGELNNSMERNLYWNYDSSGLGIFDADADHARVATFVFNHEKNLFEGSYNNLGELSLVGVHLDDFDI